MIAMDVHLILEKSEADYFRRLTGERDAGQAVGKFISRVADEHARERRLARWQPGTAATKRILAVANAIDARESKKNRPHGTQRKRLRAR